MASPYASAAKIASAEANLGGPIALDSSLLLKQLVVALGNVTGGGGGSGTVTSVAQSFTGGLISVAGSPITTSGTLALTVAGTSGGIPYFSSASTWASSAALAANALVVGGGAGAAPSTVTTGTGVVTALGVNVGTAGAFVVNGGALGTPSSGTLTNCTLPASGITGTLAASKGGTGVANGASCTLTLPNAATTITTGGTLALGGFTLTVPATGTAALLGTANAFTVANTNTLASLGTTPSPAQSWINSTAASAGSQQYSPGTVWQGNGWKTDATAASQTVAFKAFVQPVQGAAAPYGVWMLQQSVNGGAYAGGLEYLAGSGGGTAPNYGRLTVRGITATHSYSWNVAADTSTVENRFNDICQWTWNTSGSLITGPSGSYSFASTGGDAIRYSADTFLCRKSAAAIQLGLDAAGVTNQTLTAANRITSDGVGANLTIAAGNGRGAAGGSLILSTYSTAGAGTIGTLTSRMTIDTNGAIAFPNVTAVVTETVVSDRTLAVTINGTAYKICLKS